MFDFDKIKEAAGGGYVPAKPECPTVFVFYLVAE